MHSLDQKHERMGPAWLNGGPRIVYHLGEDNRCPGCGRKHWVIGRLMAECAFCETAIPLQASHGYGASPRFFSTGGGTVDSSNDVALH